MQNTNITFSPSDSLNNVSEHIKMENSIYSSPSHLIDTFTICPSPQPLLPVNYLKNKETTLLGNLLFTIIFLIIFAFVRLKGKDLLANFFFTIFKRKKAELLLNEGITTNLICYMLSLLLSFSSISVCLIYIAQKTFFSFLTLYIFCGLVIYHFFVLGLLKFLGWTFNASSIATEAIINFWTYNIMGGLLVSPFIIAIFFVRSFAIIPLLKIVILISILFLIVKFFRWVEILFAYKVSILYMILYLCALEVMPLLILYKVMA